MDKTEQQVIELTERSVEVKIRDFGELLDNIEDVTDKRKMLWKEIYENALSDRHNSYIMFNRLLKVIDGDKTVGIPGSSLNASTDWAVHAKSLATFLERMAKANDQLIKLAELVDRATNKANSIDSESMFDKISKGGQGVR